jgi:hypothetical protein
MALKASGVSSSTMSGGNRFQSLVVLGKKDIFLIVGKTDKINSPKPLNNGRFVWSGDTGRKIQNHTVQRSGLRMSDKMDVLKWQLQKNSRQSIIPPVSTCILRINILLHYCYTQFHYIFGLPLFRLDKNISQRCDCLTGKSVYINNNKVLPLTSLKTKTHANCRR